MQGSEATALIDSVDPEKYGDLLSNLGEICISKIDYIVANHAEQDHSGSIPELLKLHPQSKVLTNQRCAAFLGDLLHIPAERMHVVKDEEQIDLGGKALKFIPAAWAHWPETMFTWEPTSRILFSCDFMGAHLPTAQSFGSEEPRTAGELRSYYATIMMPYARQISKHLDVFEKYPVALVAPSHGPMHDKPEEPLALYRRWLGEKLSKEAVVIYISMHGSSEILARSLSQKLGDLGVSARLFNLCQDGLGEIAAALLESPALLCVSPVVLGGLHPVMIGTLAAINLLKPPTKAVGCVLSYGWGPKGAEQVKTFLDNLKVDFLDPILVKGLPRPEDLLRLDGLAAQAAQACVAASH